MITITGFDNITNTITFKYPSISGNGSMDTMLVNLIPDAEGKLPTGEELNTLLESYIPKAPKQAANWKDLANLVVSEQPHYTPEEDAKNERSRRIALIEWRVSRYNQEKDMQIPTTDSEDTYIKILKYIQDLRDITLQSGFPTNIKWPVEPA